jgi:hypothetical protein
MFSLASLLAVASVATAANVDIPATFNPFESNAARQNDVARLNALTNGTPITTNCVDKDGKAEVVSDVFCSSLPSHAHARNTTRKNEKGKKMIFSLMMMRKKEKNNLFFSLFLHNRRM